MEKINALIDKLLELRNSGADLATISYYAQLLQAEVLHVRARQHIDGLDRNNNVAVILPAQTPIVVHAATRTTEPQTTTLPSNNPVTVPVRPAEDINIRVNQQPVNTESKKEETPQPVNSNERKSVNTFFYQQPVNAEREKEEAPQPVNSNERESVIAFFNQQPVKESEPDSRKEVNSFFTANAQAEDINSRYHTNNNIADINSLAQSKKQEDLNSKFGQQAPEPPVRETPPPPQPVKPQATLFEVTPTPPVPVKEINQQKEETSSLNERLRYQQVEVAQKLGEMPIKDLRQAIGINDKYQFIEILFNGNSDLYERSIKTLNDCHTLQEADYWLQREIKIIQGWQEDHKLVQHFYTLLRKRFS